jgi:hypothetical protein
MALKTKVKAPVDPVLAKKQRDAARAKAQASAMKSTLGPGYTAGLGVASKFLPDSLAAHVDTNPSAADTTVLGQFQDLSKGLSADQYQATREQQAKGLQSDLNTQMANLAKSQAQTRTYGAAAGAQQANALRADSEKRADLEQQDKLANVGLINQGVQNYAGALKGQEDTTFEKQKYNAGNDMALASSRLGVVMNTASLAQTNQSTKDEEEIQKEMIAAAKGL